MLGDRAALVEPLVGPTAAATLRAAQRERDAARAAADAAARAERLLALAVLEETVAWDAAGPIAGLAAEPAPYRLAAAVPAPGGARLVLEALRDVGSAVLVAGRERAVLPAARRGERRDVPVRLGPGEALGPVAVVRDERRWTLAIP